MANKNRSTQRSDEIRRRRGQRSHTFKKRNTRRDGKISPRKPPPVMARETLVGELLGAKQPLGRRSKQARRRYDVVLNRQGAEMRLPSIPRIRVGWRLASVLLASFLFAVLYQLWTSPTYQVQSAEIYGLQILAPSNLNAVLGISGKKVFELNPLTMEEELQHAFPELSSVSVLVEFPQTVTVTVTERVPVLAWRLDDDVLLVDATGWAYPSSDNTTDLVNVVIEAQDEPPPLPPSDLPLPLPALLNSEEETEEQLEEVKPYVEVFPFLSPQMVQTILHLAEQMPQDAILTYDSGRGLGWQDARNWVVYFGNSQEIDMKLVVYQAILDHLVAADTLPTLISVEYVHAPYYRLEP